MRTFSWITTLGNALIIKDSFITRWWTTKLFTPPSGYEFQKWVFITNRLDIYELVNNKLIWSSRLESLHAITTNLIISPPPWRCGPTQAMASPFLRFLDHTPWCIIVSRTPLDEWSACHRDLYLTTHNNHNRQTSMPPVGFEPTSSGGEQPQTYALERAANGTGNLIMFLIKFMTQK